jgi:hypothetical protein
MFVSYLYYVHTRIRKKLFKWWPFTLGCYLCHWSMMTPCDEGWMTRDGPSYLIEVSLVWLASQYKLFMSFLSSRLHPFLLILLSCRLSALWSFDTFLDLPPHSLFYACKGLVDNTYLKKNIILKHGLFV